MKISADGQITIPRHLLERCGLTADMEVEITVTGHGLYINNKAATEKFVAALKRAQEKPPPRPEGSGVYGMLAHLGISTDEYMREVRGAFGE